MATRQFRQNQPAPHVADSPAVKTTTGLRQCPGAAAQAVMPLINGPLLAGEVLARWQSAMALAVDTEHGTRVIGLLTAEASGVPHGIRLNVSAQAHPFKSFSGGDPVFVGAGTIQLPGWQIRPTRIYATAVSLTTPDATSVDAFRNHLVGHPIGIPQGPLDLLRAALADNDAAQLRRGVSGLVGLGAGLTPGGDDILAGLLVGLHAIGRSALIQQITVAMSPDLDGRTTVFSADLLRMAAAGHASTETLTLLRALDRRCGLDPDQLTRAVTSLISVGHTSGADLATGLLIGLTMPAAQQHSRPRVHSRINARKSG